MALLDFSGRLFELISYDDDVSVFYLMKEPINWRVGGSYDVVWVFVVLFSHDQNRVSCVRYSTKDPINC